MDGYLTYSLVGMAVLITLCGIHLYLRFRQPTEIAYMEVPRPADEACCQQNGCRCAGATIQPGAGYLYISREVVRFRRDCPTNAALQQKAGSIGRRQGRGTVVMFAAGTAYPVLLCASAARERGIDLNVAAGDARHWWATGMAPLRVTPLGPTPVGPAPIRAPTKAAAAPAKADPVPAPGTPSAPASAGARCCDRCRKVLRKFQGGFGGMMGQHDGVNCPACRKRWCSACHPIAWGTQCPTCQGALRPNFAMYLHEW